MECAQDENKNGEVATRENNQELFPPRQKKMAKKLALTLNKKIEELKSKEEKEFAKLKLNRAWWTNEYKDRLKKRCNVVLTIAEGSGLQLENIIEEILKETCGVTHAMQVVEVNQVKKDKLKMTMKMDIRDAERVKKQKLACAVRGVIVSKDRTQVQEKVQALLEMKAKQMTREGPVKRYRNFVIGKNKGSMLDELTLKWIELEEEDRMEFDRILSKEEEEKNKRLQAEAQKYRELSESKRQVAEARRKLQEKMKEEIFAVLDDIKIQSKIMKEREKLEEEKIKKKRQQELLDMNRNVEEALQTFCQKKEKEELDMQKVLINSKTEKAKEEQKTSERVGCTGNGERERRHFYEDTTDSEKIPMSTTKF